MSWLAGAAGRRLAAVLGVLHVERVGVDVGDLGAGGAGEVAVDVGRARDAGEHRAAVTGLHAQAQLAVDVVVAGDPARDVAVDVDLLGRERRRSRPCSDGWRSRSSRGGRAGRRPTADAAERRRRRARAPITARRRSRRCGAPPWPGGRRRDGGGGCGGLGRSGVMGAPYGLGFGSRHGPSRGASDDPRQQASRPCGSPPCAGALGRPALAAGSGLGRSRRTRRRRRARRISTASAAASARTHAGVPSPAARSGDGGRLGRAEDLARGVGAGGGDEDVARPGGQEVRHVEAAGAAHQRRDALLEQQALRAARPRPGCARQPTFTSAPSAYCGRILRARSRALGQRRLGVASASTSGMPQRRQNRSAVVVLASRTTGTRAGAIRADLQLGLGDLRRRRSARRATSALAVLDADDHVQRVGIEGEVDVGLRRHRRRARVRVVDRAELVAPRPRSPSGSRTAPSRRSRSAAGWRRRCARGGRRRPRRRARRSCRSTRSARPRARGRRSRRAARGRSASARR